MVINEDDKVDEHHNHPIVERPNIEEIRRWHGFNFMWNQEDMEHMADYIKYLEMELKLCKASKGPFKKITNMDVQKEIDRNRNGTDIYGDSF